MIATAEAYTRGLHSNGCLGAGVVDVTNDPIGALIIRIGFWGPFYHNYNKDLYYISRFAEAAKPIVMQRTETSLSSKQRA